MAAVGSLDDWLQTPGIAYASMKKMEDWTIEKRMRGAVLLGFNGTPREQKMKENHTRLMNNLRDRYWKMKGEGPGETEEKGGNLLGMPSFGTQNTFCDKSGKRVQTGTQPTPSPVAMPTSTHVPIPHPQKQHPIASIANVAETMDGSMRFQGFDRNNNEQHQHLLLTIPSMPSDAKNSEKSKPFQGFQGEDNKGQQSNVIVNPSAILNGAEAEEIQFTGLGGVNLCDDEMWRHDSSANGANINKSNQLYWNNFDSQKNVRTEESKTTLQNNAMTKHLSLKSTDSVDGSFNCSTPNASDMESHELYLPEPSPVKGRRHERERHKVQSLEMEKEKEEGRREEEEEGMTEQKEEEVPTTPRVLFETVSGAAVRGGCLNRVCKEKVRNYDREPVAAAERYVKQMDRLENNVHSRLHKDIKFDKRRVKKWAGRFQVCPPVCNPLMEVYYRHRTYSNPLDEVVFDREGALIPEPEEQYPIEERKWQEVKEVFSKMIEWMGNKCGMDWSEEDRGRVQFPQKDSVVVARVVEVVGRRATICPANSFNDVSAAAKMYVNRERPPRLALSTLNEYLVVLLEQESDDIYELEYRRGWVFDGDEERLAVLLIDERRIVHLPRSNQSLYSCHYDILSFKPPLCVTVQLDREVLEHELEQLLPMGCSALYRVMREGEGEEPVELSLVRIDTEGLSLPGLFCSEVCAGACLYHREEQ